MAAAKSTSPMRVRLSDERRAELIEDIKRLFVDEFDEKLSDYRAEAILDFFVKKLGPPVYNQGVRDAARAMQDKLTDLDGEIYEPER